MGLKGTVMELLQLADSSRLERLAAEDPRAMRYLVGRLWDPDDELRQRAAAAVGAASAAHRDLGRNVLRRLLWALNDEAACNGVYGLAAIGEIGARTPELVENFVGPVASLAWDDGLRLEILHALARIAEVAPDLVSPFRAEVAGWVDDDDEREREALRRLEVRLTDDA
jgi:hypothetical protein